MQVSNYNSPSFGAVVVPDKRGSKAMGDFLERTVGTKESASFANYLIDQAKNDDIYIAVKSNDDGDYFAVYNKNTPENETKIPFEDTYTPEWRKDIDKKIEDFIAAHPGVESQRFSFNKYRLNVLYAKREILEKKHLGDYVDLPPSMKKAADIANSMQQKYNEENC